MSTTAPVPVETRSPNATGGAPSTLAFLPSLSHDALTAVCANLQRAFPHLPVLIATPDALPEADTPSNVKVINYTPSAQPHNLWVPTASDYLNAWTVAREHNPRAILLLGAEAASIPSDTLVRLANGVMDNYDLVLPRYLVGPHEALVNTAILYPLTRALYAHNVRFPLPIDAALSARAAERLATSAQKLTASNQGEALIWPVAECSIAGFSVRDVHGEHRSLPTPSVSDLNVLLNTVAGSLFADTESKAAFWQRARLAIAPARPPAHASYTEAPEAAKPDIGPMIDSFRNAYTNLRELWSLVLPPNSLLALKKLSLQPAEAFRMPDALWARTVYDFVLAYRLRTINRAHLLGAMTPLYLAWVASHLQQVDGSPALAEQHLEATAAAFENDKPYLVARWRWPDRFNP